MHKSEQLRDQQDEMMIMEEELKNYQDTNKELFEENSELRRMIEALQNNQKELVTELADLKVIIIAVSYKLHFPNGARTKSSYLLMGYRIITLKLYRF
jgi:septal ring factor EnvC (AmiA/AmiB activator)